MIGIAVYFALGAACGMGIGSAGLLVTYLVIAKGMNQGDARLVNLIFFICSGLAAAAVHLRRRKVDKALCLRRIGRSGRRALRQVHPVVRAPSGVRDSSHHRGRGLAHKAYRAGSLPPPRKARKRFPGKVTKAVCLTKIQVIIIIYAGVPGKTKLPTVSEEALASSRRRQLFA